MQINQISKYVEELEILAEEISKKAQEMVLQDSSLSRQAIELAMIASRMLGEVASLRRFLARLKKREKLNAKASLHAELKSKIQNILEIEKIYHNPDLSLHQFAEAIESTPHQVSEYLNHIDKINFYDKINTYRIKEAKELLLTGSKMKIIEIAFQVGFTSKSTFNSVFKRMVGVSPSQYKSQK